MKITIVAFDLWGFNKKIVANLEEKGAEVTFIDSNSIQYHYRNIFEKLINFINKNIFNKNIKKLYREKTVKNYITALSQQDIVLIVNPNHFSLENIKLLKTRTNKLIAYNYDSLARSPLPTDHRNIFDNIYSFDLKDVEKFPYLISITNFNYLDKKINTSPRNIAFLVVLKSMERERLLKRIADILDKKRKSNYEFIVVKPQLKETNPKIRLVSKTLSMEDVFEKMNDSKILIDLVRKDQTGLSFRIFEAIALHKKIITNNETIIKYDFYNPNNILVINELSQDIPDDFLNTPYQEISEEIYNKYTLDHWTKTVFEI